MVIILRKITDLGTPEEKVEDKPIFDVHFDDRSSVPAISYRCDSIPRGWNAWDRIGDTWKIDKDGYRKTRNILMIDGKEYRYSDIYSNETEMTAIISDAVARQLIEEITDD